jgi:hypothetical protein
MPGSSEGVASLVREIVLFCMAVEAQEDAFIEFGAKRRPAAVMAAGKVKAFVAVDMMEGQRPCATAVPAPLASAALVRDHPVLERLSCAPAL